MYTVKRTGSGKSQAVQLRAFVRTEVPLVTAKALTFTVQRAQADVLAAMPRVFKGGATRYSLGATRVETATPAKLAARVAVKDRASNGGTLPEDYLAPEVFGGGRKEKRFEKALRFAGILRAGERAILGRDAPADAFGNVRRSDLERILAATKARYEPTRAAKGRRRGVAPPKKTPYFVATRKGTTAVFRRTAGGGVLPMLILTRNAPKYRSRLDFEGISEAAALREFQPIFNRLLAKAFSA